MQADIPIPRAHDLTGSVLGGRYEVLGKLGMGGMAAVYEGRRLGLHNRVAIKVLKAELCEDPGNVKRFLREARAASVIEHDNIVQIIDFGPVDGTPVYFVMEFLEGSDLRGVIKGHGAMQWSQARPVLLQIVSALAAAHDKGIVHRDVKPANIFLVPRANDQPMVKVLDFGIAKVVEEGRGGITRGLTMTNGLLGTVAYMAPEQARGAKIDARTDIYALGVVAYQALTGVVPFTGNNPFMVLARHVNEMPRPPRELVATIPAAAEEIVLRCMAKAPEDRYQSMDELAVAIGSVPVLEVPAMGEAAPVIATGRTPVWSAPPHLDLPRGEPVQRVAATEKLGSGSGHVLAGTTEESPAQLSWAPAPAPARAPSRPQAQTERQPPPQHPAATPYKAFFVLGFGLGIVAACAVAVFAIMQFDREREDVASDTPTPVVVPPAEPAPVDPPPEPEPVEPDPVEPEPVEPEPVEPEPVEPAPVEAPPSEHVAAAEDADVAAPPSKPDPRPRTKRRRRPTGPTNADAPADTPRDRPRETKREPDLHPDLRPAYQ